MQKKSCLFANFMERNLMKALDFGLKASFHLTIGVCTDGMWFRLVQRSEG